MLGRSMLPGLDTFGGGTTPGGYSGLMEATSGLGIPGGK